MGKNTREDTENGYYIHGETEYKGGIWARHDVWYGNNGIISKQSVCAYNADDDSNIYRGKYIYRCPCCYLNLPHTEEYHKANSD